MVAGFNKYMLMWGCQEKENIFEIYFVCELNCDFLIPSFAV
jgi:hypothetical protein